MPQPVLHQSRALCSEGIVHISAAASAITMPCTKWSFDTFGQCQSLFGQFGQLLPSIVFKTGYWPHQALLAHGQLSRMLEMLP